jgi:hypothetical protein
MKTLALMIKHLLPKMVIFPKLKKLILLPIRKNQNQERNQNLLKKASSYQGNLLIK